MTVHAYRHGDLSARQVTAVRASKAAAILTEAPGATFEQVGSRFNGSRWDLLAELGDLIELAAVFAIDHHWYPYDITMVALRDGNAAQPACRCPTASDVPP